MTEPTPTPDEMRLEDLRMLAEVVDAEWIRNHDPQTWEALDRQLDAAMDAAGADDKVRALAHRIRQEVRWVQLEEEVSGHGRRT